MKILTRLVDQGHTRRIQSEPSTPEHSTVALLTMNRKLKEIMIVIIARNAMNNIRKLMYMCVHVHVGFECWCLTGLVVLL